ncbi:RNA 3'-terminal phosphate cyclase [Candidatus Woesearchaeota archaeon]|nr:RNA 3'-terminal phosphate cyclase [Candidatus Woesearchaeota archaeon]
MDERITIDGNHLEGGGQIVRTALGLSALLGKPFEVNDIRKGRKTPGLKAQHLTAVNALKELCGAQSSEVALGSEHLVFSPGKLTPRTLSVDIGTAGSITLLMQSLWLPLILGGGKFRLKIKGGTDTSWSMPIDYVQEVLVPQLRRYADIEMTVVRRGYYPKGCGQVDVKVKGKHTLDNLSEAPPIQLMKQGILMQVKGISHASSDLADAQVADRQATAAKHALVKLGVPVNISSQYCDTESTGSGITLWAVFSLAEDDVDVSNPIRLGADALGERGKRAEVVGEEAAKRLLAEIESGAAVDSHLADNLVPFVALFGGGFRTSEITKHTLTNVYTVEQFLGKRLHVDANNKMIRKLS